MCAAFGLQIYGLIWFCLHPVFSAEGETRDLHKPPPPFLVFESLLWEMSRFQDHT